MLETENMRKSLDGIHLTHLQSNVLSLDTLTIRTSPAATYEAPHSDASNEPCKGDKRDHDGATRDFDGALLGVIIAYHAHATRGFEFAGPGLKIESSNVVLEEAVRRGQVVAVHARGAKVDVAIDEVGSGLARYVN